MQSILKNARFLLVVGVFGFTGAGFQQAGRSSPGSAQALINAGRYAEACRLLEADLAKRPKDAEARALLGWAYLRLGRNEAGMDQLEQAARLAPESPSVAKTLAKGYIATGRISRAEPILGRVTAMTPDDAEAWYLLGRLYQDRGRFSESLRCLTNAARLRPRDAPTLAVLAYSYHMLGRNEEALAAYREAATSNAKRSAPLASVHASFAIFLLRLNRLPEAKEQLRLAEAIDPSQDLVRNARQMLQAQEKINNAGPVPVKILDPPTFRDRAEESGITFVLENSPTAAKHQIETMTGGVAVLDFDQDGLMDIYFVNGALSPSLRRDGEKFWNRLYRNLGNGRYEDVTARAGVQGEGYMIAAAAADYDNDGYPDLFVAGVGRNILYHNNRDGTFTDVTGAAGLDRPHPQYGRMWGIHGLWLDYDLDGRLDLFVVNYCRWDPDKEPACGNPEAGQRAYCHPRFYAPLPNQLFRNNGDGSFTDVSESSGISAHLGKGMGAATADFDGDGRPDIFVANDTEPNFLFRNLGNGRFAEVAMTSFVALNQFGKAVSAMGVDFRDFDNDGRPDLFVTDLSRESWLLFRSTGDYFEDVSHTSRVGLLSLLSGGWSNAIADFNNDGWKDLFAVSSHVMDNVASLEDGVFAQPNQLFLNQGDGTFADVSEKAGADFRLPRPHRGAAVVDLNDDGLLDAVVTALGGRPQLLMNTTARPGHWLTVRLRGRSSNRDGLGARLRLETPDGLVQWNHATQSVGFASSSDPRVHFGLGRNERIRVLEIVWPSGIRQRLENPAIDTMVSVEEPDASHKPMPSAVRR